MNSSKNLKLTITGSISLGYLSVSLPTTAGGYPQMLEYNTTLVTQLAASHNTSPYAFQSPHPKNTCIMFQHCLSRYRNTSPNAKTSSSCLERAKYDVLKFRPMPSSSLDAQTQAHTNTYTVLQPNTFCNTHVTHCSLLLEPWAHCVYVYSKALSRLLTPWLPGSRLCHALSYPVWLGHIVSGLLYCNTHTCSACKRYTETERNEDLEATLHTHAHTHTHTRVWEAKFASFSQLCIWLQRGIWLAWYIVFVQDHTLIVYTLRTHRLWECWCQVVRLSDKLDSLRWWRLK